MAPPEIATWSDDLVALPFPPTVSHISSKKTGRAAVSICDDKCHVI
jgi:hypothetical protein